MNESYDELFETVKALLDQAAQHTAGHTIRYIAVSVALEKFNIDYRIAPRTPSDDVGETHDEAVAQNR